MRQLKFAVVGLLMCAALAWGGCGSSGPAGPNDPAEPAFSPQLFSGGSAQVDNRYFPLVPGIARVYCVETEDGVETIVVEVLEGTRNVAGVECAIVRDRVYLGELLVEDTHDWYAQDDAGNVWYMGEEVVNYEYDDDGNVIGTDSEGAWEAGLDVADVGAIAEPGIIMKATLVPGDSYRQEYYPGQAEDMGEITALDVPVTLADGSSYTCLRTRDWNPLEEGSVELKYYAPGVGVVVEEKEDGSERVELKGTFDLTDASLPDFASATFSNPTQVTNAHLPFPMETVQAYVVETEDGIEIVISEVLDTPRVVDGVPCVVVHVLEYLDEVLMEDTHDWFAQDDAGNVWYLGEDVVNYEYDEEGNLLGTNDDGAWEAGVDGAEPGILMWASPVVGTSYYQEFYEEEAEDMAVVVATDVEVELENGVTHTGCVRTLEWTPLEPYALEYDEYAPGVGAVAEQALDEESGPFELYGTFDVSEVSLPDVGAATFTDPAQVTNTYLPFAPGSVWEYENDTEDGLEEILVEVEVATRIVDGIECRVVRDRVFLDGVLIEDTHDWYAQDDAGNVWYMGEDVINYEYDDDGNLIGTNDDGAWEAGVDGAEPGILMWASPVVGMSYRQEFYEDEAEDMAVVFAMDVTVTLEDGSVYTGCLQTLEWSPLDPEALEFKFYAPGVGVVREQPLHVDELVELTGP